MKTLVEVYMLGCRVRGGLDGLCLCIWGWCAAVRFAFGVHEYTDEHKYTVTGSSVYSTDVKI